MAAATPTGAAIRQTKPYVRGVTGDTLRGAQKSVDSAALTSPTRVHPQSDPTAARPASWAGWLIPAHLGTRPARRQANQFDSPTIPGQAAAMAVTGGKASLIAKSKTASAANFG